MRIEAGDGETWVADAEPTLQGMRRNREGLEQAVAAQPSRHVGEAYVDRRQDDAQLRSRHHHAHRNVAGELGEQLGVTGKVVTRGGQMRLVDRRRCQRVGLPSSDELHGRGDAGVRGVAAGGTGRRRAWRTRQPIAPRHGTGGNKFGTTAGKLLGQA